MIQTTSQNQEILDYLIEGNSITPLEALDKFQCFRLGARIFDIKPEALERGYLIESNLVTDKKTGKRYSKYFAKRMN